MGGWLLDFESDKESVISLLEQQLVGLIKRRFKPKVADAFFYSSTTGDMEWLIFSLSEVKSRVKNSGNKSANQTMLMRLVIEYLEIIYWMIIG